MYKKIVKCAAALLAAVMAGGCSFAAPNYDDIDGYAEAARAKTLYAELESGHFRMVDNSTGKVTEEFTFKYRPDGNLMYSYIGSDGEGMGYEYHNGSELSSYRYGDTQWQSVGPDSESYYVYSRDNLHPYTTEGVIAVNAFAITESSVEESDGGGLRITFSYDASLLAGSLAEMGELKSFDSVLWLNEDGYCYQLDQKGVFYNNGTEEVSDYSMFIDSMNEVEEIERPEI